MARAADGKKDEKMTEQQVADLNEIADECERRDPATRDALSTFDFGDWAPTLATAGCDDLAARVRAAMRD
jgi:hypothetical protein